MARRLPPGHIGASVFVSPHFDDVVLSCGATVAKLTESGARPTVVTVFGGEITDEVLSGFARWKHSRWGIQSIDEVLVARRVGSAAGPAERFWPMLGSSRPV
jgi:GlcNAc-PI de-N-acetylase